MPVSTHFNSWKPSAAGRVFLLACAIWLSRGAFAQPAAASISGTVRDISGGVIPGAVITVENSRLGIHRSAGTDMSGSFLVVALNPGEGYSLTVRKSGFAERQVTGIELNVGAAEPFEIVLGIAPERAKIAAEESPRASDPGQTKIATLIRSSQILNLPINGRRVDSFVLMTPGVVPDGTAGLVSFRGMAGGNTFLTDGNDTSNQFFHENAGRTRVFTQISQDAVQEFEVLSSGYSVEFGRASGGIINTLTRSGSNRHSGTAYLFYRDRSLNARDPHSAINPPEERYQSGASVGGPFAKNRLFYFFNAEIQRRDFPLVSSLARRPLFNTAGVFVGQCDAAPEQCAAAIAFLRRPFRILDRTAGSELGFGKIDWVASSRNHFSASMNYLSWSSPNGFQTQAVLNNGEGVGANGDSSVRTRYGRLAWTYVPGGARVNEARFGWFKDRHSDRLNSALIPETGLAQITVEGQPNLGVSPELPRIDPSEQRFQFADTLTVLSGSHVWKFGFEIINTHDYVKYLRNRNGSYQYADFTHFALDFSGNVSGARNWQTYSQRFGDEIYSESVREYDWFVGDEFRLNSRLTLNYGLRHEYTGLPQPKTRNPEYAGFAAIPSIRHNFAPRFGAAVRLDRSRTILRVGYGIFYARYQSGVIGTFFQENGVSQRSIAIERRFLSDPAFGPVFPNALPSTGSSLPRPSDPQFNSTIDLTLPSPDYRNPYTQQGDVTIEHAFSPSRSVSAAYLWSRGLRLTTVRDINAGDHGAPVTYSVQDEAGNNLWNYTVPGYRLVNRVNPNWRRVNVVESGGNSYYNGLVVQARQRLASGIEGLLSYTWSHAIDFNQGGGADNIFFADGPRSFQNGDYRGEKASSQLDQRHRMVISSTWSPAFAGVQGRWARFLAQGWRLSQISTFASSQPATPAILVNDVPFPGAAFNSTINGFGGSTRAPFLPASSLDIDTVIRTDARLTKVLSFRERVRLHLNFEAFNVCNHVSNTAVNTFAYEARSGVLRPIPQLGAGVASEGFPDGTNARRAQVSVRLLW